MKKPKSVVLLSAGLDSTVNFFAARRAGTVVLALTFDYGQRAARREISCARRIATRYGVPHQVLQIPFLKTLGASSLTHSNKKIPTGRLVQIENAKSSKKTAKAVWVPNRNGIFLNIAAGFAESLRADQVVPGFNIEEASTFPDNSEGFLKALDQSFFYSTQGLVKTQCYTTKLNKTQIVALGQKLEVDWSMIWPCYQNTKTWCQQCESCKRSLRALRAHGLGQF